MEQKERACVIIGSASSGGAGCPASVRAEIGPDALVVCADGGVRNAERWGFRPGVLVGDGDSGGFAAGESGVPEGAEIVRLPVEKDDTDTLACARLALERGFRRIFLLGCTGGRLDHFLGSVAVLEYLYGRGAAARLCDADNDMRVFSGGTLVFSPPAELPYVSVLALDRRVTGVTLRGFKYPLEDRTLVREFPLGVSNEPLTEKVSVGVKTGRILVVCSRDGAK